MKQQWFAAKYIPRNRSRSSEPTFVVVIFQRLFSVALDEDNDVCFLYSDRSRKNGKVKVFIWRIGKYI